MIILLCFLLLVFLWIDFKCVSYSISHFVCCCRFRGFSYWRNSNNNNNNKNNSGNKSETAYSFSCPAVTRCLFIQQTKKKDKDRQKKWRKNLLEIRCYFRFFQDIFLHKDRNAVLLFFACFLTGVFFHQQRICKGFISEEYQRTRKQEQKSISVENFPQISGRTW